MNLALKNDKDKNKQLDRSCNLLFIYLVQDNLWAYVKFDKMKRL